MKKLFIVKNFLIVQRGVSPNFKKHRLLVPLAILSNYSMIFVIALLDISFWVYQHVYFSIIQIPKVPRSKYMKFQRHKIKSLTLFQKINCLYCEYANSVLAWAKAVANQTEKYSCAIKYDNSYPEQEYQEHFYSENDLPAG